MSKNFETKLENLDTLVKSLEQQNLPLDQAIDTFKKGIELINECQSILKTAEQTIQQLSKNNSLEKLDLKDDN